MNGNIKTAINCHQSSFNLAADFLMSNLENNSINFEAKRLKTLALFNIGLCKIDLWEIEDSLSVFNQIHSLNENNSKGENGLHENEDDHLYCLAFLNCCLGFKEKAFTFATKSYSLTQKINYSSWSQGYSLLFLGLTYKNLAEIEKSFEMYQKAMSFAENSHYKQVKAKALYGIAELYREQEDFTTALSHHTESIELLEKIGAKCDLAEAYYQLALTYQKMGDTEKSQPNFQQAIRLFTKMEAPKQVEKVRRAMENG